MEHGTLQFNTILIFVPLLGLGAQWLAWQFRIPAIILLILAGAIFGPILGIIQPQAQLGQLLSPLVKVFVALILFEGGLSLHLYEFREASNGVGRLIFPSVPISWGLYTLCAHYSVGFNWPMSLIFGAIIVVTGPTVIIPLLRHANLKRRPSSYIKWEGIINDPLGALLAVLVFQYFLFSATGEGWQQILWSLAQGCIVALILGVGGSYLLAKAFIRGYVPEFLKSATILGAVLMAYALSNAVQDEAGLLATTLFGLVIGNIGLPSTIEIRRFNETLGVLLISGVFILLTANIELASFLNLDWKAALLIFSVIFIARPLAIFISMIGSDVTYPERILLAFVAPRGIVAAAVAGVFAYDLIKIDFPQAQLLVPMIFLLIVASVIVYGFSISPLAKKLKLAAENNNGLLIVGASHWNTELAAALSKQKVKVLVVDTSWQRLKTARMQGLPYYYGQVLSENTGEELDLSEIGYILAATENDAYNVLVCTHFSHKFGRNKIFQLPILESFEEESRGELHPALIGRTILSQDYTSDDLSRLHFLGDRFQSTKFTEKFTPEEFKNQGIKEGFPVLLLRANGSLDFYSKENKPEPKVGDVLIIYGPVREDKSSS
ncbi:MAG: cation:proton antiporter [Candidatus Berkiella sp.]